MPDVADQPAKRRRGMLWSYVAGFVLVALALFGAWFWTAWDNWQFDEHDRAAMLLAYCGHEAVPLLTTLLHDEDGDVRMRAAEALEKIRGKEPTK